MHIRRVDNLLNKVVTRQHLAALISIQNVLGIFAIFSSPFPFPPKTSIGLLTLMSAIEVFCLWRLYRKDQRPFQIKLKLIDCCVYLFFVANALSLIFSTYIFDITNFRLLVSAVVQYLAVRLFTFTKKEQQRMIWVIGAATITVSFISLFQALFKDAAVAIANKFLFGEAAYSIASDISRGRGAQWGNIILTFPFFLYLAFSGGKRGLMAKAYVWAGAFLLPLSFVLSNFRGLTLCFFAGVGMYLFALVKKGLVSLRRVVMALSLGLAACISGILLSSFVFQYNLVDRFLLKESDRDIKFSLGRFELYEQALSAFRASPVFGIGVGNYSYTVDRIRVVSFYNIIIGEGAVEEVKKASVFSHNDFLTVLAETGLFGFCFYIGILFVTLRKLSFGFYKHLSTDIFLLRLAFFVSVCMLCLSGLFENTLPNNTVYLFFLYAAAATWFN